MVAQHPITSFLVLTFLISWTAVFYFAAGQAGLLGHEPSVLWMVLVAQFGPAYAALILVGICHGRRGITNLLNGIRMVRFGWGPGLLILLHFVGAFGVAVVIHRLFGGDPLPTAEVEWSRLVALLIGAAVIGVVFGGLSEEPGWRAYLLPRLQRRLSPVLASVAIGTIWALWHLEPGFVAAGVDGGWGEFWSRWAPYQLVTLPEAIALALILTMVYNRTEGSLFAVMLLHSVHNAFLSALPEGWRVQLALSPDSAIPQLRILFIMSLWAVAVLVWWWYRKHAPVLVDENGLLTDQHEPPGSGGRGPTRVEIGRRAVEDAARGRHSTT